MKKDKQGESAKAIRNTVTSPRVPGNQAPVRNTVTSGKEMGRRRLETPARARRSEQVTG